MTNHPFNVNQGLFWIILTLTSLSMNGLALLFQHFVGMEPCVLCIDIRISLYLVTILSFLTYLTKDKSLLFNTLKYAAFAALIYSLYLSVSFFLDTTNPNPFAVSCSIEPNLPAWMPLHEWIPFLFEAKGMCGETEWEFAGMGLVQLTMLGVSGLVAFTGISYISTYLKELFKK
jgi:disulfide bond formation protein DsbB